MHASSLTSVHALSHSYRDPLSLDPMRGPQSEALRRSLHLSIDPSPYHGQEPSSTTDTGPSPNLSTRASIATSSASSYSAVEPADLEPEDDYRICSAFCLYDFRSDDPDHLPFRKKDVLDIVKQENSGWWAAVHRGGTRVGWIPSAFVQPLADELADTYDDLNDELQAWTPDQNLSRANTFRRSEYYGKFKNDQDEEWIYEESDTTPFPRGPPPNGVSENPPASQFTSERTPDSDADETHLDRRHLPSPPSMSVSPRTAPLLVNKPTPPTPVSATRTNHQELFRDRSESATITVGPRTSRWRADPTPSPRLASVSERSSISDDMTEDEVLLGRPTRTTGDKIRQITGDENAQKYVDAKAAQVNVGGPAWYLRAQYADDELSTDTDGLVRTGTLRALVERLTLDVTNLGQDKSFSRVFFLTFRTFASADDVFSMLTARYEAAPPEGLSPQELEDWRERKLRPTQSRVLSCLTAWLEDHGMLHEDPHIARRMQEFLSLISQPPALALTAQLIMQSLERMTFSTPGGSHLNMSASKRKKVKVHKNDLLRMDASLIAQHLTTLEWRLYVNIKPQECLNWAKAQSSSKTVVNLSAFCATHERLSNWVKHSVLSNDGLGKRADTVDFWIRVAEKCRACQNFSSMSAIVTGLSSSVVARLHLTWAHVGRASHLDPLARLSDPTTKYALLRRALAAVESPCVPFVAMYLSDLVHIDDEYPDMVPGAPGMPPFINFAKRQKWADAVTAILRHQAKPHMFPEDVSTMTFIEQQLTNASMKDINSFWMRSQELQQAELAHADIRKGLEAAGF